MVSTLRHCTVCCVQVGAGIKGVSPGEETQDFLIRQQQLTKLWGGALLGILAVSAMLLDAVCMHYLGASFSAQSLLLIVGFVTTTQRQVTTTPPPHPGTLFTGRLNGISL